MHKRSTRVSGFFIALALLTASACAPAAAPSPTAAPAQPAATAAPAKAETKPAEKAAEKEAAKAPLSKPEGPTEKPAAKAETKAETKPAAKTETKPAAKAEAKVAAKASFDEKAVADFYQGKTVKIVVGFAPGGGYDTYSRVIARHMPKHIPGNPNMIVENQPGSGSMRAMNSIYTTMPKDGTVIGNIAGGLVLQQVTKNPSVEYDVAKMEYLGAPSFFEYLLLATGRSGFTSLDQIMGPNSKQMIVGSTGVGSGSYNTTVVVKETLDLNMKQVSGYEGSSKVRLAMESGEVDGYFNSWDSAKTGTLKEIESEEWKVLLQVTDKPIKDLPQKNVPMVMDLAQTEEQKQLLRFGVIRPNQFARPYVLAPQVPEDRVRALQSAFMKTLEDKEFLAEAQKAKLDIQPIPGPELRGLIIEYLTIPEAVNKKLEQMLQG